MEEIFCDKNQRQNRFGKWKDVGQTLSEENKLIEEGWREL